MKAMNIAASRPAATFSARLRSQAPVVPMDTLLQRVDLLEHPLRPLLRFIRGEVHLLRVRPERIYIRRIDLEALLLEALGQLGFALLVLRRAPGDRLVDGGL